MSMVYHVYCILAEDDKTEEGGVLEWYRGCNGNGHADMLCEVFFNGKKVEYAEHLVTVERGKCDGTCKECCSTEDLGEFLHPVNAVVIADTPSPSTSSGQGRESTFPYYALNRFELPLGLASEHQSDRAANLIGMVNAMKDMGLLEMDAPMPLEVRIGVKGPDDPTFPFAAYFSDLLRQEFGGTQAAINIWGGERTEDRMIDPEQ